MTFPGIDADINVLAAIAEEQNGKDKKTLEKLMDLTALINYVSTRENKKSDEGSEEE